MGIFFCCIPDPPPRIQIRNRESRICFRIRILTFLLPDPDPYSFSLNKF